MTLLVIVSALLITADTLVPRLPRTEAWTAAAALAAIASMVGLCILTRDVAPLVLIGVGLIAQLLWSRNNTRWLTRNVLQSVTLLLVGSSLYVLLRVHLLGRAYAHHPCNWGLDARGLPLLVQLPILLLVEELVVYWIHRLDHGVPWLWRFHKLHHAPTEINLFATDRDHPWFTLVRFLAMLGISYVVGVTPQTIYCAALIRGTVNSTNHWDVTLPAFGDRLRWWALLISTPTYHAWHHTVHCRAGANLAELFPLVDALFGTLEWPRGDPKGWRFGLDRGERIPANLLSQILILNHKPPELQGAGTDERPRDRSA